MVGLTKNYLMYGLPTIFCTMLPWQGHSCSCLMAILATTAPTPYDWPLRKGSLFSLFHLTTTHFSQPLHKGCFGLLKSHWRVECHRYMSSNPGHVVIYTRTSFGMHQCVSLIISVVLAWARDSTPKGRQVLSTAAQPARHVYKF